MLKKLFIITLNNKFFILILLLGLFLRLWNYQELYMYSHDQDLQGWIIKDVLVNHHPRLIGQETSTHGIFIGPYFYYLLIPFCLLFGLDPIGGVFMTVTIGVFGIWSFYFCLSRVFNRKVGLISAFIYSISFYTVFNDREVVPTMPVILWTIWFFYALHLIKVGHQKVGFLIGGFLIGLIWNLNMALILLIPLIPISFLLSKKKLNIKNVLYGLFSMIVTSVPLIFFEVRHNFSQTHAFIVSLASNQRDILQGVDKFKRLIYLIAKDLTGLISGTLVDIKFEYLLLIVILIWLFLIVKRVIKKDLTILTFSWIALYVTFFSLYSKILSEYYLNGLIIIWITILSVFIFFLLSQKKLRFFGVAVLGIFGFVNLYRIFTIPINKSGYVERKEIVKAIKEDSNARDFDCVSISYITDPGFNLGYRYLFWLEKVKTKPISNNVPVYTIVFPLKSIFKTDVDFGALGLIYPNYSKYNLETVKESCKGEDFNLVDSMFGYTEK